MRPLSLCLLCCLPFCVFAQNLNPRNENRILDEDIAAVQFYLNGSPLSLPLVQVKASNGALVLEFDHLGDETQEYQYTILHCDSDWQPSALQDNEYLSSYTDDRILDFASSFNTRAPYTHYTVRLPNANIRWTKSGNYLLRIFVENEEKTPVLERRFCVVEPLWRVTSEFVRPAQVGKQETHHELDFIVNYKDSRVNNPLTEVRAVILQNGRWDNAVGPVVALASRGNELVFDYQDKIVFPAGREYRYFDIRSLQNRGDRVRSILVNKNDQYEITLETDRSRATSAVSQRSDLNGRFYIQNQNPNQTLLQADYGWALFSIAQNAELDADVYLFGELTDWQLKPQFKLTFHPEANAYWGEAFLKQGFYNYAYQVVKAATGVPDEEGLEGNDYRATNQYTILVYFRPYGTRYDRLMGAGSFDSTDWNK